MKRIAVIDNYDSFTYNLVHYLVALNCHVAVLRNDSFELEDLCDFDKLLLSPGPGLPEQSGLLLSVIKRFAHEKSILGICLGQQAIGLAFGGKLENLQKVYHGLATPIHLIVDDERLFEGLDRTINVGRYHSWVVSTESFPEELEVTSVDEQGCIMSLRHRQFDLKAVQFHPESVLTPDGKIMLANWVNQ